MTAPTDFDTLVAEHRGELFAHCYRMLGSPGTPRMLGDGLPAFNSGVTTAGFRLTDVRRWEGSENVLLSYEV